MRRPYIRNRSISAVDNSPYYNKERIAVRISTHQRKAVLYAVFDPHYRYVPSQSGPSTHNQGNETTFVAFIAIFKNSANQNSIFAICSLRMLLVH